jgi:hypothetical protein
LKSHLGAFEADMVAGMPPYQLIQRHVRYLHPHQLIIMDYMPYLRESAVGAFQKLRDNPPFPEFSVPLVPVESHETEWENGVGRTTGMNGWLTFALPADVEAAGIRLRYTYSNAKGTEPYLAIYWKSQDQVDFGEGAYSKYSPTGDRANWQRGTWLRLGDDSSVVYVWICQPVQTLRVCLPFEKGTIKIHELEVLARR